MNPVAKAFWFIESYFTQELTLDDVAKAGGVSRYHMSRVFGIATGCSVCAIVRGRRPVGRHRGVRVPSGLASSESCCERHSFDRAATTSIANPADSRARSESSVRQSASTQRLRGGRGRRIPQVRLASGATRWAATRTRSGGVGDL